MDQFEEIISVISRLEALLGGAAAVSFAIWVKYLRPWAQKIDARTLSTDNGSQ